MWSRLIGAFRGARVRQIRTLLFVVFLLLLLSIVIPLPWMNNKIRRRSLVEQKSRNIFSIGDQNSRSLASSQQHVLRFKTGVQNGLNGSGVKEIPRSGTSTVRDGISSTQLSTAPTQDVGLPRSRSVTDVTRSQGLATSSNVKEGASTLDVSAAVTVETKQAQLPGFSNDREGTKGIGLSTASNLRDRTKDIGLSTASYVRTKEVWLSTASSARDRTKDTGLSIASYVRTKDAGLSTASSVREITKDVWLSTASSVRDRTKDIGLSTASSVRTKDAGLSTASNVREITKDVGLSAASNVRQRTKDVGLSTAASVRERATIPWQPHPTNEFQLCPSVPKGLVGQIAINMTEANFTSLERKFTELGPGGHYKPPNCRSRYKVAIIIPYRNREKHLKIFLNNMHPFLQKQQLEYAIYVVEQKEGTTFNRAMLMNVGFTEAMKDTDYDCCAFHDVDLVPEDDRNLYTCPHQARHLSVAIDIFGYRLPYGDLFGGAVQLRSEHVRKINGFSNVFWGWGGEDDDFASRVKSNGLHITRYPVTIARYKMIHHKRDKGNPDNPKRFQLLQQVKRRARKDGLNSLKYDLLTKERRKLYTLVYVELDEKKFQPGSRD